MDVLRTMRRSCVEIKSNNINSLKYTPANVSNKHYGRHTKVTAKM